MRRSSLKVQESGIRLSNYNNEIQKQIFLGPSSGESYGCLIGEVHMGSTRELEARIKCMPSLVLPRRSCWGNGRNRRNGINRTWYDNNRRYLKFLCRKSYTTSFEGCSGVIMNAGRFGISQELGKFVRHIEFANPRAAEKQNSRRSFSQRLGWYAAIVIPFGVAAILAILAFLWYIWNGNSDNEAWRKLMVNEWITITIALVALVLRTSAAVQASACTSIFAALALEQGRFVLSKSAALSSIRYLNSGPHNLFLLYFGGDGFKRKIGLTLFILVLGATTIVSQFSSTLLLSDLKASLVPGNMNNLSMAFGINSTYGDPESTDNIYKDDLYLWSNKPLFYPTFAEHIEDPIKSDGISDTGMALRAFLPLGTEQSRSVLRDYVGPATVFDSRVTCVRPWIDVTAFEVYANFSGQTLAYINGTAVASKSTPQMVDITAGPNFNCDVVFPPEGTSEWAITMCGVTTRVQEALISPFQSFDQVNRSSTYFDGSVAYLMINTTGTDYEWQHATNFYNGSYSSGWRLRDNEEWLELRPLNASNIKLSMSLCYGNVIAADLNIHAYSDVNRTEPTITSDEPTFIGDFKTQDVRRQLGVTIPRDTPDARGILNLEPRLSWFVNSTSGAIMPDRENRWNGWTAIPDMTFIFCPSCLCCSESILGAFVAHRYLKAVFQDIIQTTGRPALALQAFNTIYFQEKYYEHLSDFNAYAPAKIQSFVSVLVPASKRGLIAVTTVLLVHLILVFIAVAWFRSRTQYSLLGNSWQSVSQTFSPATESIYDVAPLLTDTEVGKILAEEGRGKIRGEISMIDTKRAGIAAVL